MARQLKPTIVGSLKLNEDGPSNWTTLVWRLPNGGLRISGSKANVGENTGQTGGQLKQLTFDDLEKAVKQ